MADVVAKLAAVPLPQLAALGAALVLASFVLFTTVRKLLLPKNAPPTIACMPIIGGILKFIKGPMFLMGESYPKYGQVFTVPVLHKRITFLLGPEVTTHFFRANDEQMSQKEVYEFNVPTFGKGVVFDVDAKTRAEQFRFFAESLKTQRMKTYVQMMVMEAEQYFEKWPDSGEVNLLEKFSDLIILTASRCLLGREVREHLFERVSDLFHDLDNGMLPISVFAPYIPIPAHNKRDKARAELAKIFTKVIRDRKASGKTEDDMLQSFIDARYKDGRALTEDQICGLLIAALFAGQHTSSVTSTWTGLRLGTCPDWYKKCVEEQEAIVAQHGKDLDYDILQKMECLHASIKETLRLHPPLILLMRLAREAFEVTDKDGRAFTIPKGDVCVASPSFQHRLDHVFERPESFEPDRFVGEREKAYSAAGFSYIGFGAGRHGCMGETFAYLQIKTIWSVILRQFDIEIVGELPEPDYEVMVIRPKGDCKVRFKRRVPRGTKA